MDADMQGMMMRFYKGVFTRGETWYTSTIKSLIMSAVENEAQYNKEQKEEIYYIIKKLHDDSLEPYELIIETQIGLVLVMCQTYITRVISQVNYFYKDYEFAFKTTVSKIDSSKRALLASYGPQIKGVNYRSIEIIDALANYFKHHEEWGGNYRFLKGNEKRTAEIVSSVGGNLGLSLWYSRNLSKCTEKLGVRSMENLSLLLKIVDDWKLDIGKSITELGLE